MGVFTWKGGSGQGGSGNLALAANWLNEDDPADPVVPGADDGVLIDATGTLTGSLDVQSETISGDFLRDPRRLWNGDKIDRGRLVDRQQRRRRANGV